MARAKVKTPKVRVHLLERARAWLPVVARYERAIAGDVGPETAKVEAEITALEAGEPVEVRGWVLAAALGGMGHRDPAIEHDARYIVSADGSYRPTDEET